MIRVRCECGRVINAKDEWAGRRAKCPQCGRPILIEASAETSEAAPAMSAPPAPPPPLSVPLSAPPLSTESLAAGTAGDVPAMPADVPPPPIPPLTMPPEPLASEPPPFVASPAEGDDATASPPPPRTGFARLMGRKGPTPVKAVRASIVEDEPAGDPGAEAPVDSLPPGQVFLDPEPPPKKGVSGLGVLAVLVGLAALAACWIPAVRALAVPLGAAAVVAALLGILLSIVRRRSGAGLTLVGGLLGLAAVAVALSTKYITRAPDADATLAGADSSPPADATVPPAPPSPAWTDASQPVEQEDARVKVTSVRVGTVTLKGESADFPDPEGTSLAITVEVTNLGTRRMNYASWAGRRFTAGDVAFVTDDLGNPYARRLFEDRYPPVGRTRAAVIEPGQVVTDVLAFQPPAEGIGHLDLELPGRNFGGTGMVRIRIPASMIKRE